MLEIPDMVGHREFLLDAEIARLFFHSTPYFFNKAVDEVDGRLLELERGLEKHNLLPSPLLPESGYEELPVTPARP